MKRDMELIKKILLEVEGKESPRGWIRVSFDEYTEQEIDFHVKLLKEENLIVAKTYLRSGHSIQSLTMSGYDFIEQAKKDTVWSKALVVLNEKGIEYSLSKVTELLKNIAMSNLNFG